MPAPLLASLTDNMTSRQNPQVSPEHPVTPQNKRFKLELKSMSSSLQPSDCRASEPADPRAGPSSPVYCCDEPGCTRRFKRKYTLLEHTKTHTGEQLHVCPVRTCKKRFSTSGNLSRHKLLHGYIDPLECPVEGCYCTFPSNNKLDKHMKFHCGSAAHVCTISHCGKTFSTTGNLNRHVKHQHSEVAASVGRPCASRASKPTPTNSEPLAAVLDTALMAENNADASQQHPQVQSSVGMEAFQGPVLGLMDVQEAPRPYLQPLFRPQQQQEMSSVPGAMGTWYSDEMVDALTEIFDETVAQPEFPADNQSVQLQGDDSQGQLSILDDMINFHVANLS